MGVLEASGERLRYERTEDDDEGVAQVATPDVGFDENTHEGVWFWTMQHENSSGGSASVSRVHFLTDDHTDREASNRWEILFDDVNDDLEVRKVESGSSTTMLTSSPDIPTGTDFDVRIERDPDTHEWEVFYNGSSQGTFTDSFVPTVDGALFTLSHEFIVSIDRMEVF
ncbi:hypothetical protein ACFQHN_25665 [Natrialbaceae archaeon GCM10025896]